MDKFKNKYRIPSARLQSWDYGTNGAYFITICTHNREHYFGEIAGEPIMQLNAIGTLAEKFWMEIPTHFPFVELGNFVVMPNHLHGILIMDKIKTRTENSGHKEALQCHSSTIACDDNTQLKNRQMASISPKQGSISTIVRSYKSAVSKHARYIHTDFNWQTRFYEHIIRKPDEFERIQDYIASNPIRWIGDTFNDNTCRDVAMQRLSTATRDI